MIKLHAVTSPNTYVLKHDRLYKFLISNSQNFTAQINVFDKKKLLVSVLSSSSSHMSLAVILQYIYFNVARRLTEERECFHKHEVIKAYKNSEVKYLQIFNFRTKVEIHG